MINAILSIPVYTEPDNSMIFLIVMIVLLGLGILGSLIASIYGLVSGEDDMCYWFFGAVMLGIVMILPITFLTAVIDNDKHYPEWYASEIVEVQYDHIYSLDLDTEVSGSFRLGYGSIDSDTYYYFYVKDSKGFYREKIKIEPNVRLNESDTTPRIEERKEANSAEVWVFIYVPVGTVVDSGYNPN